MAELTSKSTNSPGGNVRKTNLKPGKVDLTAMVDLVFLLITFFYADDLFEYPKQFACRYAGSWRNY